MVMPSQTWLIISLLIAYTLLTIATDQSSSSDIPHDQSTSSEHMTSSYSLKNIEKPLGQSNFLRWRGTVTIRKILDLEDFLEITVMEPEVSIDLVSKKVLKKRNLNASLLMQGTIIKEQQYFSSIE